MFFQHENRFRSSFSILFNFQGPVRLSLSADDLTILSQKRFFVKHFFSEAFRFLRTCDLTFQRSHIGSSLSLPPPFRSHSFRRPLALKYNTTSRPVWQPLFSSFLSFFRSSAFLTVFCSGFMVPLIYTYISKPLSELSISTNFVMHYLQTLHPRLDSVLSLTIIVIRDIRGWNIVPTSSPLH